MTERGNDSKETSLDDFKSDEEIFNDFLKSEEGKYIEKEGDKYTVSRTIKGERKVFGQFTLYEYALEYERNLIINGWTDIFNPLVGSFGKFIRKEGSKYYIIRKVDEKNRSFGSFDSLIDALLMREELIDDNWGSTEELNFSRESRFGKYITYFDGKFIIQKNIGGEVYNFGYFDTIADATAARDILLENNWDDSKVPESLYSWRFFTRYHPLSKSWEIYNLIGEDLVFFGLFKTVELARKALKILIENNWDTSYIPLDYYHEDSNIRKFKRPNGKYYYSVVRRINDSSVSFGSFEDYDEAIEFRNELLLSNWDLFEDEEEQFDDYIYFKDDVYRVKKDGKVYGEFDDIAEAADFRIECIKNNWWVDE